MGNICCHKKFFGSGKDSSYKDKFKDKDTSKTKNSIFKFNFPGKIVKSMNFSEKYIKKKYSIKEKKRLMVELDDNSLFILTFYLEKFIFLTTAIEINDNYKMISSNFLSTQSSNHYYIVLLNDIGEISIVIINLQKIKYVSRNFDAVSLESSSKFNSKKASSTFHVESFLNSMDSHNNMIEIQSSNLNNNSLKTSLFFKDYSQHKVMKMFDKFNTSKFQTYLNNVQFTINVGLKGSINTQIKVLNYEVFVFSNNKIICFLIDENLSGYSRIMELNMTSQLSTMLPLQEGNLIMVDGTTISMNDGKISSFIELNEFFNIKDNFILNNIQLCDYSFKIKLDNSNKLLDILVTLVLWGECGLDYQKPTQYIAIINFTKNLGLIKNSDNKSKIRILNQNHPKITHIKYGPYSNGPIITGQLNGLTYLWKIDTLEIISVLTVFEEMKIDLITNENNGMTIFVNKENSSFCFLHINYRKKSYFFKEDKKRLNVLETICD